MSSDILDSNEFSGGVFSKELPNGRASATIVLEFSGIRASASNDQEFWLRYDEINLDVGGASGRMVFCRNGDKSLTIFCEDKKFPAALDLESSGELRTQLESKLGHQKKERRNGKVLFVSLAIVLVLLLVGLYSGIKVGAKAAVRSLPYAIDEQIGELAIEQMEEGFPESENQKVINAIEAIVKRLESSSSLPEAKFTVRVVNGPIMNAYALPGGYITVYTGMIDESESPEEIAGVIAHEMAHVTLRHGIERIAGQVGIVVAAQLIFGDANGLLALGAELGAYATQNSYSRSQETEADLEGARMLYEAGLDPLSVVPLFEDLKVENDGIPAWMGTHPDMQGRIDRLKEYARTLPPKKFETFDNLDWPEIKRLATGEETEEIEIEENSEQEQLEGHDPVSEEP